MKSPKMTRKLSFYRLSDFRVPCRLIVGGMLLCAAVCVRSHAATPPDWLMAANRVELGDFGKGSAAVVVDEWREFTVDAAGKYTSVERRAVRVLNRQAAEPYIRAGRNLA